MLLQYEEKEANNNQNNIENAPVSYWSILRKVCLWIISFAIGLLCVYLTIVFINYWNRNNIDEHSLFSDEQIEQFQELQHQIEQQYTTNYPLCEQIIDGVKVRSLHSKCRAPEPKIGRKLISDAEEQSCFDYMHGQLSSAQNVAKNVQIEKGRIKCYFEQTDGARHYYQLNELLLDTSKLGNEHTINVKAQQTETKVYVAIQFVIEEGIHVHQNSIKLLPSYTNVNWHDHGHLRKAVIFGIFSCFDMFDGSGIEFQRSASCQLDPGTGTDSSDFYLLKMVSDKGSWGISVVAYSLQDKRNVVINFLLSTGIKSNTPKEYDAAKIKYYHNMKEDKWFSDAVVLSPLSCFDYINSVSLVRKEGPVAQYQLCYFETAAGPDYYTLEAMQTSTDDSVSIKAHSEEYEQVKLRLSAKKSDNREAAILGSYVYTGTEDYSMKFADILSIPCFEYINKLKRTVGPLKPNQQCHFEADLATDFYTFLNILNYNDNSITFEAHSEVTLHANREVAVKVYGSQQDSHHPTKGVLSSYQNQKDGQQRVAFVVPLNCFDVIHTKMQLAGFDHKRIAIKHDILCEMDDSSDMFKMKRIVGFGTYGFAVQAYSKNGHKDVVIKFVITDPNPNVKNVNDQQVRAMYEFTHHQTVELLEVYINTGEHRHPRDKALYLRKAYILEFCDGGDLKNGAWIRKMRMESPENKRDAWVKLARTLLNAGNSIFEKGYIYREITPVNILRCSDEFKIGDFGLMMTIDDARTQLSDKYEWGIVSWYSPWKLPIEEVLLTSFAKHTKTRNDVTGKDEFVFHEKLPKPQIEQNFKKGTVKELRERVSKQIEAKDVYAVIGTLRIVYWSLDMPRNEISKNIRVILRAYVEFVEEFEKTPDNSQLTWKALKEVLDFYFPEGK